jgi:hypothetical protein
MALSPLGLFLLLQSGIWECFRGRFFSTTSLGYGGRFHCKVGWTVGIWEQDGIRGVAVLWPMAMHWEGFGV